MNSRFSLRTQCFRALRCVSALESIGFARWARCAAFGAAVQLSAKRGAFKIPLFPDQPKNQTAAEFQQCCDVQPTPTAHAQCSNWFEPSTRNSDKALGKTRCRRSFGSLQAPSLRVSAPVVDGVQQF